MKQREKVTRTIWIDMMWAIQHNTGTWLNKVKSRESEYELREVLDAKREGNMRKVGTTAARYNPRLKAFFDFLPTGRRERPEPPPWKTKKPYHERPTDQDLKDIQQNIAPGDYIHTSRGIGKVEKILKDGVKVRLKKQKGLHFVPYSKITRETDVRASRKEWKKTKEAMSRPLSRKDLRRANTMGISAWEFERGDFIVTNEGAITYGEETKGYVEKILKDGVKISVKKKKKLQFVPYYKIKSAQNYGPSRKRKRSVRKPTPAWIQLKLQKAWKKGKVHQMAWKPGKKRWERLPIQKDDHVETDAGVKGMVDKVYKKKGTITGVQLCFLHGDNPPGGYLYVPYRKIKVWTDLSS